MNNFSVKIALSEFIVMCRELGYFNLNDIETAIFEYNGKLTVLQKSDKRPLNPYDMNIKPPIMRCILMYILLRIFKIRGNYSADS